MGGGSCSTEVTTEETKVDCQMCGLDGHTGIECPWVYTRCRKPGCNGSRKLLRSTQPNSVGRRFLTCQKSTCKQFQWLEEALSLVVFSPPQSYYVDGCFGCGDTNHWINACPWRNTPCSVSNCDGCRKLSISGTLHNYGIPYLKCPKCNTFEWMSDVLAASKSSEIELNLDEVCKFVMKKLNIKN